MLKYLSKQLTAEFGKGFNERNLQLMRKFYITFTNPNTLCTELSWSHYRLLMQVENDCAKDDIWSDYAKSTDYDTFRDIFRKRFVDYVMDRYEQNNDFFMKLMEDPDMMEKVGDTNCKNLYSRVQSRRAYPSVPEGTDLKAADGK